MADFIEVAKATVTIIPNMKGIQGSIATQLSAGAAASGKSFGGLFEGGMMGALGGAGKKLLGVLGVASVGAAIGAFFKEAVDTGKEFDNAMSQVAATMGTTTDAINGNIVSVDGFEGSLRDLAKELGSQTAFTATQAAEALNYMALAGYDAETSARMLPQVLNLAAAGSMDLATASDMVTDAQTALGLSVEETETMVDQMAKTASTTNTSVEQLGSAMLTVGGTAKIMRGGTDELNQVLGLLADNGIKGSEGGTALRNILLSLGSPTDKAKEQIKQLGVAIYDSEGNMRSMKDIMGDFNSALDGMTDEERTNIIATIFNKRDLKSVNALLGTNAERWDEVAAAIDDSKGAAEQMADTQLDNLEGDLTILDSAFEGLKIQASEFVIPALRKLAQWATDAIGAITQFLDDNSEAINGIGEAIGYFGDSIGMTVDAFGKTFDSVGKSLDEFGKSASETWDGVVQTVSGVPDTIAGFFTGIGEKISGFFSGVGAKIKGHFDTAVSGITSIPSKITGLFGGVAGTIGGFFNQVKTKITTAFSTALNFVKSIPSRIIGFFTSIPGRIAGIFNTVKQNITRPIETAKQTLSNIINRIKSIFNVKLKIPLPKVPKISVYGGQAPWGFGGVGKPPKISVAWAATGGITDGISLLGVGEAGREAIVPLSNPYMAPFARAVAEEMPNGGRGDMYFSLNYTNDARANDLARDTARLLKLHLNAQGA